MSGTSQTTNAGEKMSTQSGVSEPKFGEAFDSLMIRMIIDRMSSVLSKAVALLDVGGREGGYFCITDQQGNILLLMPIGRINDQKVSRCRKLAEEKAVRLATNKHQLSSWQSRNEPASQYGGAIRTSKYILSFSGMPEHVDEAMMLVMGMVVDAEFDRSQARWISSLSVNQHALNMLLDEFVPKT